MEPPPKSVMFRAVTAVRVERVVSPSKRTNEPSISASPGAKWWLGPRSSRLPPHAKMVRGSSRYRPLPSAQAAPSEWQARPSHVRSGMLGKRSSRSVRIRRPARIATDCTDRSRVVSGTVSNCRPCMQLDTGGGAPIVQRFITSQILDTGGTCRRRQLRVATPRDLHGTAVEN